jgi:hypothetical protein
MHYGHVWFRANASLTKSWQARNHRLSFGLIPKYWLAQLNSSHAVHFFANDLAWRGRLMAPPKNWQPKVGRASWGKNQTYPENFGEQFGHRQHAHELA